MLTQVDTLNITTATTRELSDGRLNLLSVQDSCLSILGGTAVDDLPGHAILLDDLELLRQHGKTTSTGGVFVTVGVGGAWLEVVRVHLQPDVQPVAVRVVLIMDDLHSVVGQLLLQILRGRHADIVA